jgi:hypothetical protein
VSDDPASKIDRAQAWTEFCDLLKKAGDTLLRDGLARSSFDSAEGHRYLLRLLRAGSQAFGEQTGPLHPVFRAMPELVKMGLDNPDNYYLGASISGEPCGTTDQPTAELVVGSNRAGNGIPKIGWPDGAGYTHYKWRLDGGTWSAETPVDAHIAISGLADGVHYVEVVGKRDSGTYQDDPALGQDAVITRSRTWTVQTKK